MESRKLESFKKKRFWRKVNSIIVEVFNTGSRNECLGIRLEKTRYKRNVWNIEGSR